MNIQSLIHCVFVFSLFVLTGCRDSILPGDPCDDLNCQNNGYCISGACACETGWTGLECTQQSTPIAIVIRRVNVLDFPAYDGGQAWDFNGSAADITLVIRGGGDELYNANTYYADAAPGGNYPFNSIDLTVAVNLYNDLDFVLYNYDEILGGESFMGGVNGSLYNSVGGFPSSKTLSFGGYSFEVYLDYLW